MNLIPFEFENHFLRVQLDANGKPWFNASDVCDALEMGNPSQAVKTHVDGDDLQKLEVIDNLGRTQLTNHVSESGLFALIFGSTKKEATKFKRWVTHEGLPSIRKTGFYSVESSMAALTTPNQDIVTCLLMIGESVAKVPGVKRGIAMAATLNCIHENTGLSVEQFRKSLPACNEPICSLNPTQLGERMGMSARATNARLQAMGPQFTNDRDERELTEAGQQWAEALPFSRNGHSGYQILWKPVVTEQIREVA